LPSSSETSLGLVAGYVGGKINTAIMRTVRCVLRRFPSVLLAIAIFGARWAAGIVNSIVSLTIVFVPQITRRGPRSVHHRGAQAWISSRRRVRPAPARSQSCACTCSATCLGPIFVYATGPDLGVSMILAAGPVIS